MWYFLKYKQSFETISLDRLHTFQNGKRSQNVDRATCCEMQIHLNIYNLIIYTSADIKRIERKAIEMTTCLGTV